MTASDHGPEYHSALATIIGAASSWAEHAEKNLTCSVPADAHEDEVASIAATSNVEVEQVQRIADVWAAIKIIEGSV